LKGILSTSQGFQVGKTFTSFKIGLFREVKKHVSLVRNPCMFEEGVLAHFFPVRIELLGERYSCYLSAFVLEE
jgi:hypothetical protein